MAQAAAVQKLRVRDHPHTDVGNAERFAWQHGNGLRYCHDTREWFVWDGGRWSAAGPTVMQLAKKTVRTICSESIEMVSNNGSPNPSTLLALNGLHHFARRSEQIDRLRAMIELAKCEPPIAANSTEFDRDPGLLTTLGRTIELDRAFAREPQPGDRITRIAPVEYDRSATCPAWEKYLAQVLPDPEIIAYIQRAVGYSLTGQVNEECIFVLLGGTRNGKGTFTETLHALMGDYATVVDLAALLDRRPGPSEDLAALRGRRFVQAHEPPYTRPRDSATLKWLSGGDRLRARRLYERSAEFQPVHKLWLTVNALPAFSKDDEAIWARLQVIRFEVKFVGKEDRRLKTQLKSELPGILNWALRGCVRWHKSGLAVPPAIHEATERERCRRGV